MTGFGSRQRLLLALSLVALAFWTFSPAQSRTDTTFRLALQGGLGGLAEIDVAAGEEEVAVFAVAADQNSIALAEDAANDGFDRAVGGMHGIVIDREGSAA